MLHASEPKPYIVGSIISGSHNMWTVKTQIYRVGSIISDEYKWTCEL